LHVVWSGLSYSSWKLLFLYLCFNEITFGPLKSQGTSSSSLTPGNGKDASEALACSPKSPYHLAQLLGLDHLADLAFHDIINKMTSENVVGELFSEFTAQNDRLMKRQSLLLTSTLKTPNTISVFQRYVQEVASGAVPHCRDALKFAFGNTVDAIKEERQKIADERKAREAEKAREMSRPMLKCNLSQLNGCMEVSVNSVVRSRCSCNGSLRCSACNRAWKTGSTCGGCGKVFR